jgi:hypothetical protein
LPVDGLRDLLDDRLCSNEFHHRPGYPGPSRGINTGIDTGSGSGTGTGTGIDRVAVA